MNLETKISIGLTTYENKDITGITDYIKSFIVTNNLEIAPLRILGNIKRKNDLKKAISSLSYLLKYKKFFRGITKVSSQMHYEELITEFNSQDIFKTEDACSTTLFLNREPNRVLAKNHYGFHKSNIKNLFSLIRYIVRYLFLKKSLKDLGSIIRSVSKRNLLI